MTGKSCRSNPPIVRRGRGLRGKPRGKAGRLGNLAIRGGLLSIFVVQEFEGRLHVDLSGQDGGDGGMGVKGAQGARGARGQDAVTGDFGIGRKRPGTVGAKGYTGNPGGHGGNAGNGGHGGVLNLFNIGPAAIADASYSFVSNGGREGGSGTGGLGGDGGLGGEGGSGAGNCDGGPPGQRGDPGKEGDPGEKALRGADGTIVARNLDLELMLRQLPA